MAHSEAEELVEARVLLAVRVLGHVVRDVEAILADPALEALADKVCLEHDVLIGRAKDLGSSLVFIALIFMKIVWLLAVLQYFNLIT